MKTWRTGAGVAELQMLPSPLLDAGGCFGASLDEPCPASHAEAGAWCETCSGTGRVRARRPRVETKTA